MSFTKRILGEKIIVFFLLFVISACSYPKLEHEFPNVNAIKVGHKFCVILPENHNEKEYWRTNDSKNTFCEHLNSVWHGNEKGIYFNFQAKSVGTDTLFFSKLKQKDTVKIARYVVRVIN